MLSRFSPTLRSALARRAPLSPASTTALAGSLLLRGRSAPPTSPSSFPSSLNQSFQTRGVASEVAANPGSQSLGQAATNVKEEVSGAAAEAVSITVPSPSRVVSSPVLLISHSLPFHLPLLYYQAKIIGGNTKYESTEFVSSSSPSFPALNTLKLHLFSR